jgi:hypothetical protein
LRARLCCRGGAERVGCERLPEQVSLAIGSEESHERTARGPSGTQALPGNALLARLCLAGAHDERLHPQPKTEEQAEPARQCVPRLRLGTRREA